MSQVPSERRVTTEPSGRVKLLVEKACPSPTLDVADDPELEEVLPLPEFIVVVFPPMVVDELTLPPPAVTDDDVPVPPVAIPSMTVHLVPSSRVMVSAAKATPAAATAINGERI